MCMGQLPTSARNLKNKHVFNRRPWTRWFVPSQRRRVRRAIARPGGGEVVRAMLDGAAMHPVPRKSSGVRHTSWFLGRTNCVLECEWMAVVPRRTACQVGLESVGQGAGRSNMDTDGVGMDLQAAQPIRAVGHDTDWMSGARCSCGGVALETRCDVTRKVPVQLMRLDGQSRGLGDEAREAHVPDRQEVFQMAILDAFDSMQCVVRAWQSRPPSHSDPFKGQPDPEQASLTGSRSPARPTKIVDYTSTSLQSAPSFI